jgi:hypothetical protein
MQLAAWRAHFAHGLAQAALDDALTDFHVAMAAAGTGHCRAGPRPPRRNVALERANMFVGSMLAFTCPERL